MTEGSTQTNSITETAGRSSGTMEALPKRQEVSEVSSSRLRTKRPCSFHEKTQIRLFLME